MLEPDSRSHLMELLRPPVDCRFDSAIGTTFSLDLMSALVLPLSFVFFDWEHENGELSDPLAMLEALRLNGDRFSIFCQAGNIRLPGRYSQLVTFLEPCVHEVLAPDAGGVFHPKVWVVRYLHQDGSVKYRVLCLSRNLTFDRSWDTVVALDGELSDSKNAFSANRPLSAFVAALPGLCVNPLAKSRQKSAQRMADELLRVRFDWPDGFDGEQCRFWISGLSGKPCNPFPDRRDQCLIVSPFLSESVLAGFVKASKATHLVSRPDSLQEIPLETLEKCGSVHFLLPQLSEEVAGESPESVPGEVLEGLHAKLFVIDQGWDASVFSGSFNATRNALERNVEFMVEMVGKKSKVGVDRFLTPQKGVTGFPELLQPYDLTIPAVPGDPLTKKFDSLFLQLKREIIVARPRLSVSPGAQPDLFHLSLLWSGDPPSLTGNDVRVSFWPITVPRTHEIPMETEVTFRNLSHESLTPMLGICLQASLEGTKRECAFVLNLPLEGAPADRQDRVVASLLQGKEQLLRYILFLLAAGDEDAANSGDLAKLLEGSGEATDLTTTLPSLLETLLRALHRGPAQMQRVASLLDTLKRSGKGKELMSGDFQTIWDPIWEVARQTLSAK